MSAYEGLITMLEREKILLGEKAERIVPPSSSQLVRRSRLPLGSTSAASADKPMTNPITVAALTAAIRTPSMLDWCR